MIVVVEELVDEAVIRADPNRTIIPGLIVDAVVVEPWGAHPSYVQGAYDRDNRFYLDWDPISRDEAATQAWLARVGLRPRRPRRPTSRSSAPSGSPRSGRRVGAVRLGRLRGVPLMAARPMILVAGPYRSGTDGDLPDPGERGAMTAASLELGGAATCR